MRYKMLYAEKKLEFTLEQLQDNQLTQMVPTLHNILLSCSGLWWTSYIIGDSLSKRRFYIKGSYFCE